MTIPRHTPSPTLAAHHEAAAQLRELLGDSLILLAAERAIEEMQTAAQELEEAADRLAGMLAEVGDG
jgi:hypothetical protein